MTILEAIQARHSVRHYLPAPLTAEQAETLQAKIDEINAKADLHIQLVLNEPKCFSRGMAYGQFKGVENYLVVAGRKAPDLDDRAGYYGEQLVLLAWHLGLGSCWAGLTYKKQPDRFELAPGEKIACMIALGTASGEPERTHRRKTVEQVSNAGNETPEWFRRGVEAALKAPTAVNQQRFRFDYLGTDASGRHLVRASRSFSLFGYTQMDLGIAKLHFEIGAGDAHFVFVE